MNTTPNKIDFNTCRVSQSGNIITPKARMSFPVLFDPKPPPGNPEGKKRFGVALLIPAGADLALLQKNAKEVAETKWGVGKLPKNLKSPFLDAGAYEYQGYEEGWSLIRATTVQKPGIVNAKGENVSDEQEVYPGRWCVASLRAFAYDQAGNRGVSFGLQNIQLLDHDTALGGRVRAEDEFTPVDDVAGAGAGKNAQDIFA